MSSRALKLTAIITASAAGLALLGYVATEVLNPKPSLTVYAPNGRMLYRVFDIRAEQVRQYRGSETLRGNRIVVENADRLRQ